MNAPGLPGLRRELGHEPDLLEHVARVLLLGRRAELLDRDDGAVGLAPMTAVMGFLRAEGAPYHAVMGRAGRFAADWTCEAMPAFRRRMLMALPRWWRSRRVLAIAAAAIRQGYGASRATVRVRRGTARIEIKHSLFCRVREPLAVPQCDFHAAMVMGLLSSFGLPGTFEIERCTGSGDGACVISVDLNAVAASVEATT